MELAHRTRPAASLTGDTPPGASHDLAPTFDVVVPTIGRDSLAPLVASLLAQSHRPAMIVVVDDRPSAGEPLPLGCSSRVLVLRSNGRGPAAARNVGWRAGRSPWVVFVDDDVVLPAEWSTRLVEDLGAAPPDVAGVSGRLHVPLPAERRPTDAERYVAGLGSASWATADMAYRRVVLDEVDGFDERFPRACREDADLAIRVRRQGHRLGRGMRVACHPVRPAPWWASVARQRGNADDALLYRTHGTLEVRAAGVPRGRRRMHAITVLAALAALGAGMLGRPRAAVAASALWIGCTADLARVRIEPGPRNPQEVAAMVATSIAIPPAATWWWLRGALRARRG